MCLLSTHLAALSSGVVLIGLDLCFEPFALHVVRICEEVILGGLAQAQAHAIIHARPHWLCAACGSNKDERAIRGSPMHPCIHAASMSSCQT